MATNPAQQGLHGVWLPSYYAKQPRMQRMVRQAAGLHIRGVVAAVRTYDEPSILANKGASPIAVYADVAAYWSARGLKPQMIYNCLVMQPRSGLHDGDIWIPRASTIDVAGSGATDLDNCDVMNLDGDHVILTFLDDNVALPIIIGTIPHPQADRGKDDSAQLGDRIRVQGSDGNPRLMKHHGVVAGVDTDGNVLLDTTRAHDGSRNADGSETAASEDGSAGNITITVQSGATLHINGPDGQQIDINADGTITIGNDDGQILINSDGTIELGDDAAMKSGVVRLNDTTTSDITIDPQFWAHYNALAMFVAGLASVAGVTLPPTPTALGSQINSASSRVSTE